MMNMDLRKIYSHPPVFGNPDHIAEVKRRLKVFELRTPLATRDKSWYHPYEIYWDPETFTCPLCKSRMLITFDDIEFGCENPICPVEFEIEEYDDYKAYLFVKNTESNNLQPET